MSINWKGYVVATLVVAIALGIALLFLTHFNKHPIYVFLGAVMVATWYGGLGPGLLATGLSSAFIAYFLFTPTNSLNIDNYAELWLWIVFNLVAILIVHLHASKGAMTAKLTESEQRLRLALEAAGLGVWDYSVATGAFWISPGLAAVFGRARLRSIPSFEQFLDCIHPDDRDYFRQAVERTLVDQVDYEIDFRALRPDGSTRSLVARGRAYGTASGSRRMVGVISDVNRSYSPSGNDPASGAFAPVQLDKHQPA